MDKRTQQVKDVIEQYGTKLKPLSAKEIADFLEADENAFGSSLVRLIRSEPYIHRGRPVVKMGKSVYVYWPDTSAINPEFKGTVKKHVPRAAVSAPVPDAARIVIPISTGSLQLTPCDARKAYQYLKEIYQ